jgi:hypothetical protein
MGEVMCEEHPYVVRADSLTQFGLRRETHAPVP